MELDYFIQRLQKEGNEKRVKAIQKKQQFLEEYIQSMQQVNVMAEVAA